VCVATAVGQASVGLIIDVWVFSAIISCSLSSSRHAAWENTEESDAPADLLLVCYSIAAVRSRRHLLICCDGSLHPPSCACLCCEPGPLLLLVLSGY
jgi:hypothetical protein